MENFWQKFVISGTTLNVNPAPAFSLNLIVFIVIAVILYSIYRRSLKSAIIAILVGWTALSVFNACRYLDLMIKATLYD